MQLQRQTAYSRRSFGVGLEGSLSHFLLSLSLLCQCPFKLLFIGPLSLLKLLLSDPFIVVPVFPVERKKRAHTNQVLFSGLAGKRKPRHTIQHATKTAYKVVKRNTGPRRGLHGGIRCPVSWPARGPSDWPIWFLKSYAMTEERLQMAKRRRRLRRTFSDTQATDDGHSGIGRCCHVTVCTQLSDMLS